MPYGRACTCAVKCVQYGVWNDVCVKWGKAMRYDAVLMDADETILDFRRAEETALKQVLCAHGIAPTPHACKTYSAINRALWGRVRAREIPKEQIMARRFVQLVQALGAPADPAPMQQEYQTALGEAAFCLPHAKEVCAALCALCPLYLVTNGTAYTQDRRMHLTGLDAYFAHMFISERIGAQKPTRAFFDAVLAQIGPIDPARVLMVGDSLYADMGGAKAMGFDTCWFNPQHAQNDLGIAVDYEIDSLLALPQIVRGSCV